MNKKETLEKIKESLKSLMKFSDGLKSDVKCSSYELTDGTKITSTADVLGVDSEVYLIDELGNQTPLNNGDYVLTDGRTISVVDNLIKSIADKKPVDELVTPLEEDMKTQKMSDGMPEGEESEDSEEESEPLEIEAADVVSRITDIEKQITDILNIIKNLGSTQVDVNEQMMSKIEKLSELNGDEPIKLSKKASVMYDPQGKSGFADELKDFLRKKQKNK